ncbi:MAG: FAD-dependent oxidoreductase [Steroidobacteraceae bacterium]
MQYSLGRREFMTQAMAGTAVLALPAGSQAAIASLADTVYDLVIVGAGTAGLPAAIFAAQRGAKVILLEAAGQIGGTLHLSTGQMSAAGTRLQRAKGIKDTPDMHYDDVMRISRGTADPVLTRLAVDAAAETFDWLMDRGFAPLDEHPILGLGHEPYSERRYYWGAEGGRTILATLRRDFDPLVTSGKVDLLLQTPVTALLTNDAGAVEGVRIQSADRERIVRGRHVLLTCGGYASNTEMFERLSGYRDYADTAYPYSMGAGLELGVSVGGFLRGRENYLCNFGSILTDSGFPGKFLGRFTVVPQRRQPWEVFVNAYGERFIREDEPSFDKREHALLKQPDIRYWIVFDEQIFATAPPGVGGWSREQMREAFGVHSWFQKADSLQALAEASGIDPQGLIRTIEAYNAGVSSGADPWGREHKPLPIVKPPFYAIRHQGHSTTSTVGLAVDGGLRVIRPGGQPITNLYAAGELLGAGQTQGKSFVGGMMITPALSFGRLLGQTLPLGSA